MILTTFALVGLCFILNLFNTSVLAEESDNAYLRRDFGPCRQPLQRREWRALSDKEKKCYINAVKCMQTLPAWNTSRPQSWTRFDEFQSTHIGLAPNIHYVGQFLPWHRLFLKSYENALRNECGYNGAQPYWDWSIDADTPNLISQSPIWDPDTGFGGDGVPGTYTVPLDPADTSRIFPDDFRGCIKDGPFANYTLKLGPGILVTEHCITRGVNDLFAAYLNSSMIAYILSLPTFEKFRVNLEGVPVPPDIGPHGAGHVTIGGDMSNYFSSPGEPLFYLHHANLDRIWWRWQNAAPERIYEVDGPTSTSPPYGHLTLDYSLKMGNIGLTLPVQSIMDIRMEPSCYTYV